MSVSERLNLIFTTITMVCAQISVFIMLSETRYNRRKVKIAAAILGTVCLSASIIPCWILELTRETDLSLLTLTLPSLIFFFIVSRYRGIRFIVTYCIADMSIACMDMFGYCISLLLFDGDFLIDMFVRCILMLVWMVCILKIVGSKYQKALGVLEKGWGIMMAIGVGIYVLMGMMSAYPTPIRERLDDIPTAMVTLVIMELTLLVVIRAVYSALEVKEKSIREQEANLQLALAEQQYHMLAENVSQIRGIKHDMKHHFLVMSQLLKNDQKKELEDYIEHLSGISDLNLMPYGKNPSISVLAVSFKEQAEKKGIGFECCVVVPESLPVSAADITVVLGNTWQNAIEACEQVKEAPLIKTDIIYRENKLVIKCENNFSGQLLFEKTKDGESVNKLLSTKGEGRGQGLANICRIAERYQGHCYYECHGNKFILTIILTMEGEKQREEVCIR